MKTEMAVAAEKQCRIRGISKNKLMIRLLTAWLADLSMVGADPLDAVSTPSLPAAS